MTFYIFLFPAGLLLALQPHENVYLPAFTDDTINEMFKKTTNSAMVLNMVMFPSVFSRRAVNEANEPVKYGLSLNTALRDV